MILVDTGDQVVCTVAQRDGHSSPDHTVPRAEQAYSGTDPSYILMPLNGLTGSVLVLCDLTGSTKKAISKLVYVTGFEKSWLPRTFINM